MVGGFYDPQFKNSNARPSPRASLPVLVHGWNTKGGAGMDTGELNLHRQHHSGTIRLWMRREFHNAATLGDTVMRG